MTLDGRVWWAREPLEHRLGEWLDGRVLAYNEERRVQDERGFDDFPGGGLASKIYVILRIDRRAPWGAVHEMLRRVGQRSLYKVRFLVAAGGGRRSFLQAFLPMADRDYVYITARVDRDGGISLDGRGAPDLTEAIESAYRPLKDGDRAVAGLIDADPAVPFEAVVRALDAFACAGVEKVDLAAGSVRAVVVPRR